MSDSIVINVEAGTLTTVAISCSESELLNESSTISETIRDKDVFGDCTWKDVVASCKGIIPILTSETKEFLNDLGVKQPLEILLQNKHEYVSNLILNAVKYSGSSRLRCLERDFVLNPEKSNEALPLRALSVLLVAKLFGPSESLKSMSSACRRDVEKKQIGLGFATEFLFLSYLFHTSVINVSDGSTTDQKKYATAGHKQNKVATLIGDLFITKLYSALGALENNLVTELMMDVLAQISENVFPKDTDCESPQNIYATEILFRTSFRCAVMLAGHHGRVQKIAGDVGSHFGRVYQTFRLLRSTEDAAIDSPESLNRRQQMDNLKIEIEIIERFIHTILEHSTGNEPFFTLLNAMKFSKKY